MFEGLVCRTLDYPYFQPFLDNIASKPNYLHKNYANSQDDIEINIEVDSNTNKQQQKDEPQETTLTARELYQLDLQKT